MVADSRLPNLDFREQKQKNLAFRISPTHFTQISKWHEHRRGETAVNLSAQEAQNPPSCIRFFEYAMTEQDDYNGQITS